MTCGPGGRASVEFHTRVEWMDTDAAGGIYHNSSVLRFVESAEADLMRQCAVDGYFAVAPRVRFEVDFAAPLFFGQEVTVILAVKRMGQSSLTFGFEVWGEPQDEMSFRRLAASGSYVTVHVSGAHHDGANAIPWPAEWLEKLGGGEASPGAGT